jgi:hypothetical protein
MYFNAFVSSIFQQHGKSAFACKHAGMAIMRCCLGHTKKKCVSANPTDPKF